jgi:hypothetical protein
MVEDAGRKSLGRISFFNFYFPLQNDRAGVEFLVYEMDSAAGDVISRCEHSFMDVEAGILRKQARVNIHDPVRESPDELRRQKPHITRKAYKVNTSSFQCGYDLSIMLDPFAASSLDDKSLNAAFGSLGQSTRLRLIADHDRNLRVRDLARRNRIDQCHHVRPAAGN